MIRRRRRADPGERAGLDLTPMIDVVFLLVVFFMVVSELSNLDVEQLTLPVASQAREPAPEAGRVLKVNVLDDGRMVVRGRPWLPDRLQGLLQLEAAACEREAAPDGGAGPSTLRVHLRVDRAARFEHVQRVLDACVRAGVWRTSLGASPEEG